MCIFLSIVSLTKSRLKNSNIVQFNSMLKKDDKSQQVVYYQVRKSDFGSCETIKNSASQSGIGTYTIPEVVDPLRSKLHMLIDMAIANHLDAHVMGTLYYVDVSGAFRHAHKHFLYRGI
jgi:uncharacterized protein (DUF2235 family)